MFLFEFVQNQCLSHKSTTRIPIPTEAHAYTLGDIFKVVKDRGELGPHTTLGVAMTSNCWLRVEGARKDSQIMELQQTLAKQVRDSESTTVSLDKAQTDVLSFADQLKRCRAAIDQKWKQRLVAADLEITKFKEEREYWEKKCHTATGVVARDEAVKGDRLRRVKVLEKRVESKNEIIKKKRSELLKYSKLCEKMKKKIKDLTAKNANSVDPDVPAEPAEPAE